MMCHEEESTVKKQSVTKKESKFTAFEIVLTKLLSNKQKKRAMQRANVKKLVCKMGADLMKLREAEGFSVDAFSERFSEIKVENKQRLLKEHKALYEAMEALYDANVGKRTYDYCKEDLIKGRYCSLRVNEAWSIDFTLVETRGRWWVLLIIDLRSRMIKGYALYESFGACTRRPATGGDVIKALNKSMHEYGKPEIVHTDRGGQFTKTEYAEYCVRSGIAQSMCLGKFSNQTHERANRTLKDILGQVVEDRRLDSFDERDRPQAERLIEEAVKMYQCAENRNMKTCPHTAESTLITCKASLVGVPRLAKTRSRNGDKVKLYLRRALEERGLHGVQGLLGWWMNEVLTRTNRIDQTTQQLQKQVRALSALVGARESELAATTKKAESAAVVDVMRSLASGGDAEEQD
uniref:Hypothetical reverse transcriptase n=1 Tax=Bracteacoccus aerius TaxID=50041 RepID=A0A076VFU5_9CHLO|nr:hypothetical reverse transcriptase [Bracteacoccus aerius]AIK29070.1 hypothetical reverse transcriptase [Bracteacoccus aerius]